MLPPAHSPLDPLYRRVQFLKALLWVLLFVALVLGVINQLIEGNQLLAVVHYLCLAIAYFLLGRTWGFSLSVMVIGGILIYIAQVYDGWSILPSLTRSPA